jgi:hypothetical protein
MWYSQDNNQVYFGDKANWKDIALTGERPSPYHYPVIENGEHTGEWVEDESKIPLKTKFSSIDYLDRFTQSEQEAIAAATASSVAVKLEYDRLLAADFIDLNDPRTEAGIDKLIAAGLLDAARKLELLQPELDR